MNYDKKNKHHIILYVTQISSVMRPKIHPIKENIIIVVAIATIIQRLVTLNSISKRN